jgi:hypothetical protein
MNGFFLSGRAGKHIDRSLRHECPKVVRHLSPPIVEKSNSQVGVGERRFHPGGRVIDKKAMPARPFVVHALVSEGPQVFQPGALSCKSDLGVASHLRQSRDELKSIAQGTRSDDQDPHSSYSMAESLYIQ